MTVAVRPEILMSLQQVREDVQRQVAALDRYRALKAIEQTIADFPGLDDVAHALADIRDRVQEQLDETREYRALRTIERIVPELSEVLALLAERPDAASAQPSEPAGEASSDDDVVPPAEAGQPVAPITVVIATAEGSVDAADVPAPDVPQVAVLQPEPRLQQGPSFAATDVGATDPVDPGEALPHANDADPSGEAAISAPPPSYGIAQFLNTEEPAERPPVPETRVDEGLAQFRTPPSQEGRAA